MSTPCRYHAAHWPQVRKSHCYLNHSLVWCALCRMLSGAHTHDRVFSPTVPLIHTHCPSMSCAKRIPGRDGYQHLLSAIPRHHKLYAQHTRGRDSCQHPSTPTASCDTLCGWHTHGHSGRSLVRSHIAGQYMLCAAYTACQSMHLPLDSATLCLCRL